MTISGMFLTSRDLEEHKIVSRLQEVLNLYDNECGRYEVKYDDCDSGFTRVYFKTVMGYSVLVAQVNNKDLNMSMSVYDFTLSPKQNQSIYNEYIKQKLCGLVK